MTAVDKVRNAEAQIIEVANGRLDHIDCPFCLETNTRREMLVCCSPLAELVDAVLNRIETGEGIALAHEAVGRARLQEDRKRQNMIVLN